MEQYFLIWALILIIGTLVFYVIMKSFLKTLATFLFIILLFVVITGTLTYSDFNNLKTKLEKMETAYIFEDNIPIFAMIKNNEAYQELALSSDYEEIRTQGEYYKVIVIKPGAYEVLHNTEQYMETIKDSTKTFEERAEAFNILNNAIKSKGIRYLLSEYKKENIEFYPKTMVFKIIDIIPESWITSSSSEE